jgi:peptidylprolyl isomerase
MADLIVGKGREAKWGTTVSVQYVMGTYSARKQVESTWSAPAFHFILGVGEVIPGWDKGLLGMRVGGRRELIVPPSLAYGATSPRADIPPHSTLVFIVDLVKIP